MCIRDRFLNKLLKEASLKSADKFFKEIIIDSKATNVLLPCLLYTSDAADERSSVDLGGRRIIKKKNSEKIGTRQEV